MEEIATILAVKETRRKECIDGCAKKADTVSLSNSSDSFINQTVAISVENITEVSTVWTCLYNDACRYEVAEHASVIKPERVQGFTPRRI